MSLTAQVVDTGLGQVGADHHSECHLDQVVGSLLGLSGLKVHCNVNTTAASRATLSQNLFDQQCFAKTVKAYEALNKIWLSSIWGSICMEA